MLRAAGNPKAFDTRSFSMLADAASRVRHPDSLSGPNDDRNRYYCRAWTTCVSAIFDMPNGKATIPRTALAMEQLNQNNVSMVCRKDIEMRIATWNIVGVNARLEALRHRLRDKKPDIVALQRIKETRSSQTAKPRREAKPHSSRRRFYLVDDG